MPSVQRQAPTPDPISEPPRAQLPGMSEMPAGTPSEAPPPAAIMVPGSGSGIGSSPGVGKPAPALIPTPIPESAETPPPVVSDVPVHTPPQTSSVERAIEPDPDFEKALSRAGISRRGWKTDFSLHTVPYDEILSGGPPRDGIPPIDNPKFTITEAASQFLGDQEPVIIFGLNGDVRAYPLQILTWHEIVNDMVGGVPVAVTFCPLCNAALVFKSTLDGVIHDFGTSGKLRNSDLIMWDRQTESWWQ